MIEVYKVKVSVEDSSSSNVTTKYFMTLEKASEYLEEQREYYFDDYSSDSDSERDSDWSSEEDEDYVESKEEKYREECKENERKDEDMEDDDSEDSDYPDEEITVEFLNSLFEEDNCKFRPHVVFEHYIDEEYITASISKIFINN